MAFLDNLSNKLLFLVIFQLSSKCVRLSIISDVVNSIEFVDVITKSYHSNYIDIYVIKQRQISYFGFLILA